MSYKNQNIFRFIFVSLFGLVIASNDFKDEADKGAHSDRGSLWFGPRLGKRSQLLNNEDDRQKLSKLLEAADALQFYYDLLPYYENEADEPKMVKKVIFTPKLERSSSNDEKRTYDNVEFTPRLGRRLSDDMPTTPADQDFDRQDPEQIDPRTNFFSPRLGRTMFSPRLGRDVTFSPRLGRELSAFSPRLGRELTAFSPRLGRELTAFSPRLGRELTAFSPRLGRKQNSDYPVNRRVERSTNKTESN